MVFPFGITLHYAKTGNSARELLYILHNNYWLESYETCPQYRPKHSNQDAKNHLSIAGFCVLKISGQSGIQPTHYHHVLLYAIR